MAAAGQRLPVRRALQARAGPVVQGDGGLQVEQGGGALEETRLDRVAVAQRAVAGALRGVPAHGLAVAAERLAQGAALAQPVPRGARGGRCGHAADEAAEDGGALRTGQAQLLEQGRRTELPHGPQGDVLDADRARADPLQGVDVDSRQSGRRVVGAAGPTGETPACTSWAALRWASSSTAGEQAPNSRERWRARMRSTRAHSAGQSSRGRATGRPRCWVKWGS